MCVSGFSGRMESKLFLEIWDKDNNKYIVLTRALFFCFLRFILSELVCSMPWCDSIPMSETERLPGPLASIGFGLMGSTSKTIKNKKKIG